MTFGTNEILAETRSYEPFLAHVTAVQLGTGGQSTLNLYTFTEQSWATATGVFQDAAPARRTSPAVGTPVSGYALEANNKALTVPFYAMMRFMGAVGGVPVYVFDSGQAGTPASGLSVIEGANFSLFGLATGTTARQAVTGATIAIASAGSYLLFAMVSADINVSAVGGGTPYMHAWLADSAVTAAETAVVCAAQVTGVSCFGTATWTHSYTAAGAATVQLYVALSQSTGVSSANVLADPSAAGTHLYAVKYA